MTYPQLHSSQVAVPRFEPGLFDFLAFPTLHKGKKKKKSSMKLFNLKSPVCFIIHHSYQVPNILRCVDSLNSSFGCFLWIVGRGGGCQVNSKTACRFVTNTLTSARSVTLHLHSLGRRLTTLHPLSLQCTA